MFLTASLLRGSSRYFVDIKIFLNLLAYFLKLESFLLIFIIASNNFSKAKHAVVANFFTCSITDAPSMGC